MFDFLFVTMGFFVHMLGDEACFSTPLEVPQRLVERIFERPNELASQLFAMCWVYEFAQPESPQRTADQWALALRILKVMDRQIMSPTEHWAQLNALVIAKAQQEGFEHESLVRVESRTFPRFKTGYDSGMGATPTPH